MGKTGETSDEKRTKIGGSDYTKFTERQTRLGAAQ